MEILQTLGIDLVTLAALIWWIATERSKLTARIQKLETDVQSVRTSSDRDHREVLEKLEYHENKDKSLAGKIDDLIGEQHKTNERLVAIETLIKMLSQQQENAPKG